MKKKVLFIMLTIFSLSLLSCAMTDDEKWECKELGYCSNSYKSYEACGSDEGNIKYRVDNKDFHCDGNDCYGAAARLASYCGSITLY